MGRLGDVVGEFNQAAAELRPEPVEGLSKPEPLTLRQAQGALRC